ncbi:hypothetical protein [Spirosoma utsteinense]|uniref:Uncharacterized protein n=1 Tax=Spirosoma utsteinense TaxID=2585773 RepID=A0ABR6VZB5_9BACT|nr:hypothetical protein [Spirosoma utsteinense]MBC3784589.1 hypothetical protein [Spirosoma utsteinense]MBC3789659.1 hypothetical protein [Spirosoma utsteinense]
MSFTRLQIRYQTARSLPAPYAYFYTLAVNPAGNEVQLDLAITYPDRDDIDDDELIAEGFTRDDDFSWSGRLPAVWHEAFAAVAGKTRLQPIDEENLKEDDDFWEITLVSKGVDQTGKPGNADDWQYLIQELIQATYEADKRERPFELTYLDIDSRRPGRAITLTASFANRSVAVRDERNTDGARMLPWSTLQRVMSTVYSVDFDPETTLDRRPKTTGQWLNLGTEEWYDISKEPKLSRTLNELIN